MWNPSEHSFYASFHSSNFVLNNETLFPPSFEPAAGLQATVWEAPALNGVIIVGKRWSCRGRPRADSWSLSADTKLLLMRTTAGDLFSPVLQHTHIQTQRHTRTHTHTQIQTDKQIHSLTHTHTQGRKTSLNTKVRAEQKSLEEDRKSTENNSEIYQRCPLDQLAPVKSQISTN